MSALITQHVEKARALLAEARSMADVKVLADQAAAMELFLRRRAAASDAHGDAWEIVQHANRRLGELCTAIPKHPTHGGRPKKTSNEAEQVTKGDELERLGITRMQASRWEKLAELAEKEFLARIEFGRARLTKQTSAESFTATSQSSSYDGDEQNTPAVYIEAARKVLGGGIDLDPCTNARAQKHVVCATRFYTKSDNALDHKWRTARMWLNPPYSHPLVEQLTAKFIVHFEERNIRAGLVLVNNTTDTAWFHALLDRFPVCFTRGRIAFESGGKAHAQNRQGQAFFYAGPAPKKFKHVFSEFGKVLVSL